MSSVARTHALADLIDQVLPQTQCTRCGYPDCRAYAQAIACGEAEINQCPPGGVEGMQRLAALTQRAALELDAGCGSESPRALAVIDESWCIGCTMCIKACPVDCIVGAPKLMHLIVESQCTGCELCVPVCPVDCISMKPVSGKATGWQAWSAEQASQSRDRYRWRAERLQRDKRENDDRLRLKAEAKLSNLAEASRLTDPAQLERKRQVIEAALARARAQRKA